MIQRTTYVLAVHDLDVSAAFYRDALGFEIHPLADGWRVFVRDSCRIMAGECPDATPARDLGDHSYFAYWVVEDAAAYYQQIRSYRSADGQGVEIVKTLRDEPWDMREFGLRTVDGHRIMIGQTLDGPG